MVKNLFHVWQNKKNDLSLFVACTNDSVVMVEADAKEASEDTVCDAFDHLRIYLLHGRLKNKS